MIASPSTSLALPAAVALAALSLASYSRAAFSGDFAIADGDTPAGYYTDASNVATLGNWSVGFSPAATGAPFIDTTNAPASVTLGASAQAGLGGIDDSTTSLFIELPLDGHVSFTIQVANTGTGANFYAGAEIYLSGVALYSLTEPGATYSLDFDAFSGETLEFRSVVIAGSASFASNTTTISNFTVTASAIPEPAAFASLLGLAALGFASRRRRG